MDPSENESVSTEAETNEYRSRIARGVASAAGAVALAILCCGDITVAGLTRGFGFLHQRMSHRSSRSRRKSRAVVVLATGIHWTNNMAKAVDAVAAQILSWVVTLTRFLAHFILISKPANWLIKFLPEDLVLATLQSSNKIYDAVEVSRKKVASTFAECTKELVRERYGDKAGRVAEEGLEAVGHAIGAVTAASAIPSAVHPKNAISPSSFARVADTSSHNLLPPSHYILPTFLIGRPKIYFLLYIYRNF